MAKSLSLIAGVPRMKLSLSMIVLNEEKLLGRCLSSVKDHVDDIVIVDTGSTDRTKEIARDFGARVLDFTREQFPDCFYFDDASTNCPPPYTDKWIFADHAAARNFGWDATIGDYIMWLDADDVVRGGEHLRTIAEEIGDRPCAFLRYEWGRCDEDGIPSSEMWRERIVKRGSARWGDPCHACLAPCPTTNRFFAEKAVIEERRAKKHPDFFKSGVAFRNYKILRGHYERTKDKPDSRTLFYLAQEASYIAGRENEAVELYEKYLGTGGGWDEERHEARIRVGRLLEKDAATRTRAASHYVAATREKPGLPDGYFGLARVAYLDEQWLVCKHLTELGFVMGDPRRVMPHNPRDLILEPHHYYNVTLYWLGLYEKAAESCRAGLKVDPKHVGLKGNLEDWYLPRLR